MPQTRRAPKAIRCAATFFAILLPYFQISRDTSQFFPFVFRQVSLDALGIAAEQINASRDYNVGVDDSCAAALPLAFRSPPQLSYSAGAWYHISGIGVLHKVGCNRLDPVGSDQLGSFGRELRELQ